MRTELAAQLDRWVARGLITPEQAQRILAEETADGAAAPRTAAPRTASLVTEALGYVGGVLVLVAAGTIAGRFWAELAIGGRLSVAFGAAVLLLAAGAVLMSRTGPAGGRLRAVSWLLSAVAFAGGLQLVVDDVLHLSGKTGLVLSAGGTTVYAAVLWLLHRSVFQQVAVVVALAVTVGAAVAHLPRGEEGEVVGLAVWGVGVVWMLLGWGGVVAARTAAYVCGGVVTIVGAVMVAETDWGSALSIATAVVLVAAGVLLRDLVLLGVGAVATLLTVPLVMSRLFPDTLTAPFAVLVVGALLIAGAVYTARRRNDTEGRPRGGGPPAVALGVAGGLAALVAVAVLAMGA